MKISTILAMILSVCLLGAAPLALGQTDPAPAGEEPAVAEKALEWGDYTVKAYTLSIWGGSFRGATYLDNLPLGDRTVLTTGAGDIVGYDGNVLYESTQTNLYDAAIKEIKAGEAFGARIGIYISDDFHLDLMANYSSGEAVTSMLFTEDPILAPNDSERVQVDSDAGFKVYKGGLALMYNAKPATIFGVVPSLGFGLGGIINRFSFLEDKTALYLEGNFSLNYELFNNFEIGAQAAVTSFAFEVDELGYSKMVNYATFSAGITWFIDRVPEQVRASHDADKR